MADKLRIADDFMLPLDAATQTFACIGRKGGGKTYAAGKLAELLIGAGVQTVVLDTVGNWYGLRLAADGKSPGIDVPILGGLRGDIPLEPTGGALVADVIADSGRSLVLDASQFSKADRQRFAAALGERLWRRMKAVREPLPVHLILEESQLIVPENFRGDAAPMVGVYEEIIRLGRNYGIGVTMLTQRPQSVNKEVLNQTECLLVFQVNGAHERKALKEWIVHQGMDVKLLDELPSLQPGECYVWSPQWLRVLRRIKVARKWTFDSTSTPKVGAATSRGRELKPIDLTNLHEKMAATIERAKAEDPRELRKRIADLERRLRERPAETKTIEVEKIVEIPVLNNGQLETVRGLVDDLESVMGRVGDAAKSLSVEIARATVRPAPTPKAPPATTRLAPSRPRVAAAEASEGMSGPEQRILDAVAWMESIGVGEPETAAVAFLAGYTTGGGAFNNPRGRLRSRGLVEYRGDRMLLTPEGRALAREPTTPLTTEELQRRVLERLPGPERKILGVLLEVYPDDMAKDELAQRSGYSEGGGAFNNPCGRLRTLGLIGYPAKGRAAALPLLFLDR